MGVGETRHIKTGVDKLLDLVNQRHEISLSQASAILNVHRNIISHWCDTLEEEGMICTNVSINERFILSRDYHSTRNARRRSAIQIIRGLYSNRKSQNIDALERKEQELKAMSRDVHGQVQKLKHYEKLKVEAEQKQLHLRNSLRKYDREKRDFDKQINELESIRSFLKKKSDELEEKEGRIKSDFSQIETERTYLDTLSRSLKEKEKALEAKEQEIDNVVKYIERHYAKKFRI
jgi:chromosome segregation ATPase